MHDLDFLIGHELRLDERTLDVYVLDPDALDLEERRHVQHLIDTHPALRDYVADLRAFYADLEADDEPLPEDVKDFMDRLTDKR